MSGYSRPFEEHKQYLLSDLEAVLTRVYDEVIAPAFLRNYATSGIKTRGGVLKTALYKRGAKGNLFLVRGHSLVAGVNYEEARYFQYVIEGRGPVEARKAKALRFEVDGKVIFRKRVGPAPAHDIIYLTAQDEERATQIVTDMLGDPDLRFVRAG